MNAPTIHGITLSSSAILRAVGDDLSLIRQQDSLTWADIGRVMGRSDDAAAKYADASAKMDVVAYTFAEREWGSRFTGTRDRLLTSSLSSNVSDRACEGKVLRAALAMSDALSDDEQIVEREVRKNRATLEAARDAIDAQLAKLGPKRERA